MNTMLSGMNWRYAVKKYDAQKKLTEQQVQDLLDIARLAPSSFGLEPVRIINVVSPEIRAKLREVGFGQSQMTDASHLFVFAVKNHMDAAYVDEFVARVASVRGITVDVLKGYGDMMKGAVAGRTPEQIAAWNERQAYLSLGVLIAAAAEAHIDVTPMEGFSPADFDAVLGLKELGLHSIVCAAVGFRAADDTHATYKKVRLPVEEYVIEK